MLLRRPSLSSSSPTPIATYSTHGAKTVGFGARFKPLFLSSPSLSARKGRWGRGWRHPIGLGCASVAGSARAVRQHVAGRIGMSGVKGPELPASPEHAVRLQEHRECTNHNNAHSRHAEHARTRKDRFDASGYFAFGVQFDAPGSSKARALTRTLQPVRKYFLQRGLGDPGTCSSHHASTVVHQRRQAAAPYLASRSRAKLKNTPMVFFKSANTRSQAR
jgi:hypothetical protein